MTGGSGTDASGSEPSSMRSPPAPGGVAFRGPHLEDVPTRSTVFHRGAGAGPPLGGSGICHDLAYIDGVTEEIEPGTEAPEPTRPHLLRFTVWFGAVVLAV